MKAPIYQCTRLFRTMSVNLILTIAAKEQEQEIPSEFKPTLDHGALRASLGRSIVAAAQKAGGILFGGAVRDKIVHDKAATEFYSNCLAKEELYRCHYSDPSKDPLTAAGRLLQSEDLDIWFQNPSDKVKFKEMLLANNMWHSNSTTSAPAAAGYEFDEQSDLLIEKMAVSYWAPIEVMNFVPMPCIKVDMVTGPKGSAPPFGEIDFECNGLLLTAENEYKLMSSLVHKKTPKDKVLMLTSIISDIENKVTNMVSPTISKYRLNKLLDKGWTVATDTFEASRFTYTNTNKDNCCCTLCPRFLDDLTIEPPELTIPHTGTVITTKCCKTNMDAACLSAWLKEESEESEESNKCPWCECIECIECIDCTNFKVTAKDKRLLAICAPNV